MQNLAIAAAAKIVPKGHNLEDSSEQEEEPQRKCSVIQKGANYQNRGGKQKCGKKIKYSAIRLAHQKRGGSLLGQLQHDQRAGGELPVLRQQKSVFGVGELEMFQFLE